MALPPTRFYAGGPSTRFRLPGFTLTEMLVVISLIVLLMAMALPAFRLLGGSRSVEGATNVISAALTQARADAIGIQQSRAVVCFREPSSDRIAVAVLEQKVPTVWEDGTSYRVADYVLHTGRYYVCLNAHTATPPVAPDLDASLWRWLPPAQLAAGLPVFDLVADRDRILLNKGVDCRGVGNLVGAQTNFNPAFILFDGQGALEVSRFYLLKLGVFGSEIAFTDEALDPNIPTPLPPGPPETTYYTNNSQIALMLFDEETGKTQMEGLTDALADKWVSDNATSLLINRYNGTIVKGD